MRSHRGTLWPRNRSEQLIVAGCLACFSAEIVREVFFSADPLQATGSQALAGWVARAVRDLGLILALSTMTVIGIRSLRAEKFSAGGVTLSGLGIGLCLLLSWLTIRGNAALSAASTIYDSPRETLERIGAVLDQQDLSLDQLAFFSKEYARQRYHADGILIDYVNPEGAVRVYEPDASDRESRKTLTLARHNVDRATLALSRAAMLWVLVAAASVLIGFLTPIRREAPP